MSNQAILWASLILPWLALPFMKTENIKRFMPTALLSAITSIMVVEVGEVLQWWHFKEAAYPLLSPSYIYSLNPVITILIFRFTYGRFWLFLATDMVSNLVFSYLFLDYFLGTRDILQYLKLGPFHVVIMTTVTGVLLYWYQMWQEGIFVRSR
ncbi:MAG: hypothetical protein K0R78_7 [Pelosinus sp.]|jgi:hypothetical protein|nr:hypothetical protein [Pelosinus sp.]